VCGGGIIKKASEVCASTIFLGRSRSDYILGRNGNQQFKEESSFAIDGINRKLVEVVLANSRRFSRQHQC